MPPQQARLEPLLPARRARNVRVPDPIRLVIFEDNGDAHRWTLVGGDAATLATVARW